MSTMDQRRGVGETLESDGFFQDIWGIGKGALNEYLGVLVENEREALPNSTPPYTADPNFNLNLTPAVQPTGAPLTTEVWYTNPWIWGLTALVVVLLIIALVMVL